MNLTRLSALILFILVIISCNVVSASDLSFDGNYSQVEGDIAEIDSNNMPIKQIDEDVLEDSLNSQSSSTEDYTIYVGTNSTPDGSGTKEDPFATLELACNSYNAGEQKDTVNVMINDGTYYLGSYLKFNTNNLNIVGNGSVIIKNLYNDKQQSFGSNCNFSMSNVLFNGSDFNFVADYEKNAWFTPFIGDNGNIVFDNCTFADYNEIDESGIYNYILPNGADWSTSDYLYLFKNDNIIFNSCQFIGSRGMAVAYINYPCNLRFNYCNFGGKFSSYCGFGMLEDGATIVFDSCWLGHNNGYTNAFFAMADYNPGYSGEIGFNYRANYLKDSLFANRHAILEVSENYLGDNTYEIVGELKWNDGTNDNIDKLGSMTVYLSADNGQFSQQIVTLENGAFRVNYTGESDYHQITVLLDGQKINLNNTINFTLNAPTINYGDNFNITISFSNNVTGDVYLTVDNMTYKPVHVDNQDSKVIAINDNLTKGVHNVAVKFVNDKNEFEVVPPVSGSSYYTVEEIDGFGFNITTISVSGEKDYVFVVSPIENVFVGDEKTLTITLPDDANGTITVYVNTKKFTEPVNGNTTTITINGFVAGNNVVNITYDDNNRYESKNITKNVEASVKPTNITTVNVTTTYNVAKELVITLADVNGKFLANKTINVLVGTINKNLTTNDSGQASVDVSTLVPNTYVANITFAGDELYAKSNATANVVVNKIASSITATKVTTTYNVAKNLVITLTANGKPLNGQKVTVKVGTISKTLTTNAKGQVSVDVSKLTPKTYTATFTYSGDTINAESTNTAKVVVNKATPKLTAKKATFKAKKKTKKYSIVLKDNKGKAIKKAKVTLKVKGKTYKATTNNKGKATFKITKLTKKGKATATIKFAGNTLYKAVTKKAKLTVKK